ncbi:hypothetical protein [Corynebacterium aurimucosum]
MADEVNVTVELDHNALVTTTTMKVRPVRSLEGATLGIVVDPRYTSAPFVPGDAIFFDKAHKLDKVAGLSRRAAIHVMEKALNYHSPSERERAARAVFERGFDIKHFGFDGKWFFASGYQSKEGKIKRSEVLEIFDSTWNIFLDTTPHQRWNTMKQMVPQLKGNDQPMSH